MKQIDQIIRELIADNETEEVFKYLEKNSAGNSFKNEIALLHSRFKNLNKKILAGILSEQEAITEKNRIHQGLLEIGDKLRKEETRRQRIEEKDRGKLPGALWFVGLNIILIVVYPFKEQYCIEQAAELIHSNRWITYQPCDYDPETEGFLDSIAVERELDSIQAAAFTGIITFDCNPKMNLLYRIAHRKGLRIIAGIWNIHDEKEKNNAHKLRKLVDGYCIGHDNLDNPAREGGYNFEYLDNTITIFKKRTGKPVSTTQYCMDYYETPGLLDISDWVFPDLHVTIKARKDKDECEVLPEYHARETLRLADTIADLNSAGKAILLKMVSYPAKGLRCASDTTQWDFFMHALPNRGDTERLLPSNVSVAIHSAFDPIWKKRDRKYNAWDPYTGIFDRGGIPRMAAKQLIGKRLKWK